MPQDDRDEIEEMQLQVKDDQERPRRILPTVS
jgi:hypothetical protein